MNPKQRFKVYAKLLSLYPASYRNRYGKQLLQAIADMVDDAPSASEKCIVWLRICLDFPITVCKEHFQVIGDRMNAKNHHDIHRNALISVGLFLLPIIMLAINHMLILSGPGRSVPAYLYYLVVIPFPLLAITLAGFTLYKLLRGNKATRPSLRQVVPLALVCLISLAFLSWIILDNIRIYNLTH